MASIRWQLVPWKWRRRIRCVFVCVRTCCVRVDTLCVGFGHVQMEIASLFLAVMLIQSVAWGYLWDPVLWALCVCLSSSAVLLFCIGLESGGKLCQYWSQDSSLKILWETLHGPLLEGQDTVSRSAAGGTLLMLTVQSSVLPVGFWCCL